MVESFWRRSPGTGPVNLLYFHHFDDCTYIYMYWSWLYRELGYRFSTLQNTIIDLFVF